MGWTLQAAKQALPLRALLGIEAVPILEAGDGLLTDPVALKLTVELRLADDLGAACSIRRRAAWCAARPSLPSKNVTLA